MLKLSEIIRSSAKKRPHTTGYYVELLEDRGIASDSLITAAEGAGLIDLSKLNFKIRFPVDLETSKAIHSALDSLARVFPFLVEPYPSCPEPNCYDSGNTRWLRARIIHLEEHHHWTREQVADWLDWMGL